MLLTPSPGTTLQTLFLLGDLHACPDQHAEQLDSALRGVARNLDGPLFAGEKLRFPTRAERGWRRADEGRHLTLACYGMLPATRITDVLSQVERWTSCIRHFGHVFKRVTACRRAHLSRHPDCRGHQSVVVAHCLSLRLKRPRRNVSAANGERQPAALAANDMWSIDFVSDALLSGRRPRALRVVDASTREALAIWVEQ